MLAVHCMAAHCRGIQQRQRLQVRRRRVRLCAQLRGRPIGHGLARVPRQGSHIVHGRSPSAPPPSCRRATTTHLARMRAHTEVLGGTGVRSQLTEFTVEMWIKLRNPFQLENSVLVYRFAAPLLARAASSRPPRPSCCHLARCPLSAPLPSTANRPFDTTQPPRARERIAAVI